MSESGEHAELVGRRYADAARRIADDPAATGATLEEAGRIGHTLYPDDLDPDLGSVAAGSIGCGNPVAVADLAAGETVLDLGSGAGLDVLLSARRVGPTGRAIGLDMTEDMLALARRNAAGGRLVVVGVVRHTATWRVRGPAPYRDAAARLGRGNCVSQACAAICTASQGEPRGGV